MPEELESMVGRVLAVQCGAMAVAGYSHTYFGVAEEVDGFALMLRTADGELLFIPRDSILAWQNLGEVGAEPRDKMLRPADAPAEDVLPRPVQPPESEELPRPASPGRARPKKR